MRRIHWKDKVELEELKEAIDAYRHFTLFQVTDDGSGGEYFEVSARQLLLGTYRNNPTPLELISVFRDIIPYFACPSRPPMGMVRGPAMSAVAFFEWVHEIRHRRTLRSDLGLEARGDRQAQRRLLRSVQDFWGLQAGRPLGVSKGDPDHWTVLKIGRNLGLAELTPKELAACFDELCPCGSKYHSPEYMVKLRRKVMRAFGDK